MSQTHYSAPWGKLLWLFTTVGVVVIGGVILSMAVVPVPGSLVFAMIGAVTLLGCAALAPRGYRLEGDTLVIERPIGDKQVSLAGLRRVGGLFAFSGLYWRRCHGWFRLSGTDILGRAVLLDLGHTKWMITPGDPTRFVSDAERLLTA